MTLCQALVLVVPDFDKPFHVEVDASGEGIRAILTQANQPIVKCELRQKWSTYEQKLYVVIQALM